MVSNKRNSDSSHYGSKNNARRTQANYSKSNPQAEKLLLASLINNSPFYFEYGNYLNEDDFTVLILKQVFITICSIYKDNQSDISLTKFESYANNLGFTSLVNDEDINDLFKIKTSYDDAKLAFLHVKKEYLKRSYCDTIDDIEYYINNTTDSINDIVSKIEEKIINTSSMVQSGESEIISLGDIVESVLMHYADNPGRHGIDLDLPIWQDLIGEISNGTVHMIIANTKVGKSQFGMRAALHVANKYSIPTLVCDSEMSREQQLVRAYGMYSKIPYWVLERGYWVLSDSEIIGKGIPEHSVQMNIIQQARIRMQDKTLMEKFKQLPLQYISVNGKSVIDAIPLIRQWVMQYTKINRNNIDPQAFLVYDYIKLASSRDLLNTQEYQALGLYCSALHDFVQQYWLPCLTFGQVNRNVDRNINSIAGSKRLVELVDSLSIMAKKTDEELHMNPQGSRLISIEAVRNGAGLDSGYINYDFQGDTGTLIELGIVDNVITDDSNT